MVVMRASKFCFASTAGVVAGLLLTAAVASAQNPGWRRFGDAGSNQSADPSTPVARDDAGSGQRTDPPAVTIPARLTIPPGTYVTVRTNQPLSSDSNHVGDYFSATLAEPVVVDGFVVAQRGQTLSGRVAEVDKGGRVKGVAKLGIQLTELTAVDGQQLPIETQFIGRDARSTAGRDVAAVGATTGVGAAVGAAADWGRGAAIGAGAGAAVGLAGVLLSRGAPAVIYPESLLTFRVEAAVAVSTDRAPQAFRYVVPDDYQQAPNVQYRAMAPGAGAPYPPPAPYYGSYGYPAPYPYAYPYPYYYSPYYYGPGFGVVIGPGLYRGGYYYRGFHR